jgi:hypothetical protein
LYASSNIVRVNKKIRLADHVSHTGELRKFWSENLKGSNNLEELGVNGKIMLEWVLGGKEWEGAD